MPGPSDNPSSNPVAKSAPPLEAGQSRLGFWRRWHGGLGVTTHLLLRSVITIVILGAISAGFLILRLNQGPLTLPFLSREIAGRLNQNFDGNRVTIGSVALIWRKENSNLVLAIDDFRATTAANKEIITVSKMLLTLRFASLLHGKIVPLRVAFLQPSLRLIRDRAGKIDVTLNNNAVTAIAPQQNAGNVLAMADDPAIASLQQIQFVNGSLSLEDQATGFTWVAPQSTIELNRQPAGFAAKLSASISLADNALPIMPISADFSYDQAAQQVTLNANINNIVPAKLAGALGNDWPILAKLQGVELPLALSMQGRFDRTGTPIIMTGQITAAAGQITNAMFAAPISIAGATAKLEYQAESDLVTLEAFDIQTGPSHIAITGNVRNPFGQSELNAKIVATDVPFDDFPKLWPVTMAANPRRWIAQNISGGAVQEATFTIEASRPLSDQKLNIDRLDGTLKFAGAATRYLGDLPPIEAIEGTGSFNDTTVTLDLASGHALGLALQPAHIVISGLAGNDHRIAIDFGLRGPVADVIRVIDSPPLHYASKFNLKPEETGGNAELALNFRFPLLDKLPMSAVDLHITAKTTDLMVGHVVHGQDLTDGTVDFTIDRAGLSAAGKIKLAAIPIALSWRENFSNTEPFRREFKLRGVVDDEQRTRIGLESKDLIAGPVSFDVSYTVGQRANELGGTLDLTPASLTIDQIGWHKPANAIGSAKFVFTLIDDHFAALKNLELNAPGLTLAGSAAFATDGKWTKFTLANLTAGATAISGIIKPLPEHGYAIEMNGASLDLTHLLTTISAKKDDSGPPLDVAFDIDRLILAPKQTLENVKGKAESDGVRWRRADIAATTHEAPLALHLAASTVTTDAARHLSVTSTDGGALLKALDFSDDIAGGTLSLEAELDNEREQMRGQLALKQFRLLKAPILARLLAVASITGIPGMLDGPGIAFNTFNGDFVRTPAATEISEARAAGQALGITVKGRIGRADDQLALTGLIVPINGVNDILRQIPLLGFVLTGGDGGGVFASDYSVTGTIDHPKFTVNPLTALAPGVLRRVFEGVTSLGERSNNTPEEPTNKTRENTSGDPLPAWPLPPSPPPDNTSQAAQPTPPVNE